MKKAIVVMAAGLMSFQLQAQSLDEGVKMVRYEKFETARKILTPMAASNPEANYYLGLAEIGMENNQAARDIFAKYPEDEANMAGMARLAFIQGNKAEGTRLAEAVADKARRRDWKPLRYAADAITYTDGGNLQQAIGWYTTALTRNDDPDTRIALGDAYIKTTGGGGEAMNNYERAVNRDPKNSLAYSRIGALWYAAKNYELALENYNKAKEADPANPLPYRDLANAYYWTGKYDLARTNIEKYLELSDKSCNDQIQYANILFLNKDYPDAIRKMQEVMGSCGEKPYMYRVLGYSYYETKDFANALKSMQTFWTKQDPAKILPSDFLYYGRILSASEMPDSASVYYTRAVDADTAANKSETYRQIAESFKDQKAWERSAEWYGKLVEAYPGTQPLDYFWWGVMNYYAKKYDEAAVAFEQFETRYPEQPSATYWRGRVAAAQDNEGKTGIAEPHYTRWLATDSEKKPADLMQAYQYLALYAYNKNNKAVMNDYVAKILAIDPADKLAKQLKDLSAKMK